MQRRFSPSLCLLPYQSDAMLSAKFFKFFDNFVGKTGFFAYILLKGVRTDETQRQFSRTTARKYGYRERHFSLCQPAPKGQEPRRTLPVPQRKDPVVYRLSRKRELLLLRLRSRRRRDNLCAPHGESRLYGGRQAACGQSGNGSSGGRL